MNICKFRVLIDSCSEKDIFRDIEITENQTFEDLHKQILDAFGFRGDEMASFYVSNNDWVKGKEITLMDMGFDPNNRVELMGESLVGIHLEEKSQKFIYVYDFLKMWCFYIELIGKTKAGTGVTYPRTSMAFGEAPDENSKEPDFSADLLPLAGDLSFDNSGMGLDEEIGDMFDNLGDYDEL